MYPITNLAPNNCRNFPTWPAYGPQIVPSLPQQCEALKYANSDFAPPSCQNLPSAYRGTCEQLKASGKFAQASIWPTNPSVRKDVIIMNPEDVLINRDYDPSCINISSPGFNNIYQESGGLLVETWPCMPPQSQFINNQQPLQLVHQYPPFEKIWTIRTNK